MTRKILTVEDFIRESNRIEGIFRDPTKAEIDEFKRFMQLEKITVGELEQFVNVYQPDAMLRIAPGMDVSVGRYIPPRGGLHIPEKLEDLLFSVHHRTISAYQIHLEYESLHPFTDGNGRSGRMLWAWQLGDTAVSLWFLHLFYYQTLAAIQV